MRLIWLLFLAFSVIAGDDIIFQENFDRPQQMLGLEKLGWTIHAKPGRSSYIVKDGKLHVTVTPHFKDDGYAEIDIPLCRKGQLDFDVCIDPENRSLSGRGPGLTLDIYNISTFWHNYCRDWRFYFPEPNSKRSAGFSNEPVGHGSIGKITLGKWIHYRICWDADNDRVEYYIDDMTDPALIKGDVSVLGHAEYQGGKLRIGSFGYGNAGYECLIDNIIFRNLEQRTDDKKEARSLILLFQGISSELYGLEKILSSPELRVYNLDFWRSSYTAGNTFKYNRLPGLNSLRSAKTIILLDTPAGPDNILPDFLLEDMTKEVYAGARLIIFGGLFSLDRGEFQNTALEKILPVSLHPGKKRAGGRPLQIKPAAGKYKNLDWKEKPCIYYLHDLPLRDNVGILLEAGDSPLLVSRKYGQGEALVFLGTVCGSGSNAFWSNPLWTELAEQIILAD